MAASNIFKSRQFSHENMTSVDRGYDLRIVFRAFSPSATGKAIPVCMIHRNLNGSVGGSEESSRHF